MSTQTIHARTRYERLENGLDVYLVPCSTPNVVLCNLIFLGGIHARNDNHTVALLLEELLPGSTKRHTRSALRDLFEGLGARVTFSVEREHFVVSIAARSSVFLEVFTHAVGMLTAPLFPEREFDEAVVHHRTSLRHEREDTGAQADIVLRHAHYSKGSPHFVASTEESERELSRMTRADVSALFRETLSTVGGMLCIAGDINPSTLLPAVRDVCRALPSAQVQPCGGVSSGCTHAPSKRYEVVSLHAKMNVDTVLGIPCTITREHRDYLALMLGVQVLGGSHTSRLFHELRTRQSLTYGAYASLSGFGDGYPGRLLARAVFPSDVFLRGRDALCAVVTGWVERGITARELAARKEEIVGRYQVGLSTTAGVLDALVHTLLNGRPVSFVDEYPLRMQALTLREVNSAIRQQVDTSLLVVAAAGSVDEEGKPMVG